MENQILKRGDIIEVDILCLIPGIWKNFELSSVHCFYNTNVHSIDLLLVSTGILWTSVVEDQ